MTYKWKFYLLVAHLVDENNHTACNRVLLKTDDPAEGWNGFTGKCKTCENYALKFISQESQSSKTGVEK
jgi:hypothetical protein